MTTDLEQISTIDLDINKKILKGLKPFLAAVQSELHLILIHLNNLALFMEIGHLIFFL